MKETTRETNEILYIYCSQMNISCTRRRRTSALLIKTLEEIIQNWKMVNLCQSTVQPIQPHESNFVSIAHSKEDGIDLCSNWYRLKCTLTINLIIRKNLNGWRKKLMKNIEHDANRKQYGCSKSSNYGSTS
jgi:hypothetical protein